MATPLARVQGLGSAREGAREWWLSRVTSVALVPLTLWWVAALIAHAGAAYGDYVAWISEPVTAILLLITIAITFYHTALGLQVVIEDYVHAEWARLGLLLAVKLGCLLFGVAGLFAVLRLSIGG